MAPSVSTPETTRTLVLSEDDPRRYSGYPLYQSDQRRFLGLLLTQALCDTTRDPTRLCMALYGLRRATRQSAADASGDGREDHADDGREDQEGRMEPRGRAGVATCSCDSNSVQKRDGNRGGTTTKCSGY
jgi:hypothetical protein